MIVNSSCEATEINKYDTFDIEKLKEENYQL